MRDVARALEELGLAWYLTGSEALSAYGSPRQTLDVDIVVAATTESIDSLAAALGRDYYFAEPIRVGNRLMASLIDRDASGKVDLIVRDGDAWGRAALGRRQSWSHPAWGPVWVSSLEDLVLASWSGPRARQRCSCATVACFCR